MTTPTADVLDAGTANPDGLNDAELALASILDADPEIHATDGRPETPGAAPSAAPTDANGSSLPSADKAASPDAAKPTAPETPAATPTEPVADTTAPTPAADPLASAKPLRYTVDGEDRTFDGILEVEGEGAIIPADALNAVRDRLQLADKREADNRALYAQVQAFEQAGGLPKLHDLAEQNAALNAVVAKLGAAMDDLSTLVSVDANGQLVINERARDLLFRDVVLTGKEARAQAAAARAQAAQQVQAQTADTQAVEQGLHAAVDRYVAHFGLTPEDRAAAVAQFGPFAGALVKTATPDDAVRFGMKVGERYFDPAPMQAWFADRKTMREAATKQAEAAQRAAAENAKRIAAAAPPVPRAAPAAAAPAPSGPKSRAEQADDFAAIKRRFKRGQFTDDE